MTGLPTSYGSAFDSVTGRYVLVLEDLAVDNCEFPDTLHPLTADQASQVVELLARLHATFWERVPDWVYSISADTAALVTGPLLKTSVRRLSEKTDVPVERGRFIADNYRAVAAVMDRTPNTVTHGDAHPGNIYFRNGEAGLLDWQFVRRGHPGRELAYTLITGMTPADRQTHQRDLLDHYRQVLSGSWRAGAGSRRVVGPVPARARCTPMSRRRSPRGWAVCRPRTSPWKACGEVSPPSTTSTRSHSWRSRCEAGSTITTTRRLRP